MRTLPHFSALCLALLASCSEPNEDTRSGNTTATTMVSPSGAPSTPPGITGADPDEAARSRTDGSPVDSAGQNYTFSTGGELEIVGSETQYDIILPADFLFDFDKSTLRPEASGLLQKLKQHFATHKSDQVHVYGHTDSKGSDQYNSLLSQRRAIAVQSWLKQNCGVFAMALGMGEREPLVPNENPDGSDNPQNRQRNRRVTVTVVAYPDVNKQIENARQQSRAAQSGIR